MGEILWWIMDVVGPVILLIALVWLAFRWGRNRPAAPADEITERGTREEYADEEIRRREGTDGL